MSEKKKKGGLFGWFGKKQKDTEEHAVIEDAVTEVEEAIEVIEEQAEIEVDAADSPVAENESSLAEKVADDVKPELATERTDDFVETNDAVIAPEEEAVQADPVQDSFEFDEADDVQELVEMPEDLADDTAGSAELDKPEKVDEPSDKTEKKGFFSRLKDGLSKTRSQLTSGIADLVLGAKQIDDDLLEEIETQLLVADVGVEATRKIIDDLTQKSARKELKDADALMARLRELLSNIVEPCSAPLVLDKKPFVILMVGVNGVGKTTTIGKLAKKYQSEGKSVMLAAGDTFRAAAVEQLQVWGERNNIHVTAQHTGADSASVLFDALQAAQSRDIDVLIADTAGRLHTKSNLMDELEKLVRVMQKLDPEAPHETMLVVDAGTGQNALNQAEHFHKAVGLTGVSITKLDGTAKGGVIFALADKLSIPIRFIGVGEGIDDLRPFESDDFIEALFSGSSE